MKHMTGIKPCAAVLFLIFAVSILALSACAPVTGAISPANGSYGSFELLIDSGMKTILPADETAFLIVSYRLEGSGPGSAHFSSDPFSGTSFKATGLAAGSWTMTAYGYNSGGHLIASKAFVAVIPSSATAVGKVFLERVAGSGSLDVTVNWEVASDYNEATGTLTPLGGSAEVLDLSIAPSDKSLRYTATKAAGDYLLSIQLKKSGLTKETLTEAVQVYAGYTSSKTLDRSITHDSSTFVYDPSWPVRAVAFGGVSPLTVTVKGAAGHSLYLVKSNQAVSTASAGTTGSATSVSEMVPYSRALGEATPPEIPAPGEVLSYDKADASAFNANPPPMEEGARSVPVPTPATIPYGPSDPLLTVGSHKYFWVEDSVGVWVKPQATLRAVGRYCYIWVMDSDYDNASSGDKDNKLTTAQAEAFRDRFDGSVAASYRDGIFLNVSTIFGYEFGGGSGGSGGRDEDQHISILFYDIDGDYSPTQTGGVLGYFWGKDYYSQAALGATPKTNYMEIFYIDTHFADWIPGTVASTLAHEYQHMIHFNVKSIAQSLSEPTWLNEMCSMVAQDLVCRNIGLDPAVDGAAKRLPQFLHHYAESGVTDWLSGSALKSYASAFAFGAYLERNYGGASLFQRILANNQTGISAVSAALLAEGYSDDFGAAFSHYGESLVFSDKPAGSALKTMKQTWSESLGGIMYVAEPIDLNAMQQYNLDTSSWVSAYGARVYDPASAVDLRPYGNSIHTHAAWKNLTGDLAVTLTAPSDSDVKFYLMIK